MISVLTLLGVIVYTGITAFILIVSDRQANIAAQAFYGLERPYISLGHIIRKVAFSQDASGNSWLTITGQFSIENCGRASGTFVYLCQKHFVGGQLPPPVTYDKCNPFAIREILRPGDKLEPEWMNFFVRFPAKYSDIASGNKSLYLVGFIEYVDTFGANRASGFGLKYIYFGDRFESAGGPAYNYDHEDSPEHAAPPEPRKHTRTIPQTRARTARLPTYPTSRLCGNSATRFGGVCAIIPKMSAQD